jgi:hypothetical protein
VCAVGFAQRSALQTVAARAPVPLDDLLPQAYADVPPGLHPVARRSLLAHLLKLQADGLAALEGERWALSG